MIFREKDGRITRNRRQETGFGNLPNDYGKLSITVPLVVGPRLRDRALIGLMIYTFARVSAAVQMNVKDVYPKQESLWVRLHEKGGKHHEMPCQHNLKDWLREYIEAAGIGDDKDSRRHDG